MKAGIIQIIKDACEAAKREGLLKAESLPDIIIEKPKKEEFGDISTNIAMLLAPLEKRPPREVADIIAGKIAASPAITKCDVAGPGLDRKSVV